MSLVKSHGLNKGLLCYRKFIKQIHRVLACPKNFEEGHIFGIDFEETEMKAVT